MGERREREDLVLTSSFTLEPAKDGEAEVAVLPGHVTERHALREVLLHDGGRRGQGQDVGREGLRAAVTVGVVQHVGHPTAGLGDLVAGRPRDDAIDVVQAAAPDAWWQAGGGDDGGGCGGGRRTGDGGSGGAGGGVVGGFLGVGVGGEGVGDLEVGDIRAALPWHVAVDVELDVGHGHSAGHTPETPRKLTLLGQGILLLFLFMEQV